MHHWLTMLQDASHMFLFLAFELSLLFLLISAGVSLIRQKLPDSKIQSLLGAQRGKGYAISALLGALTPFCSCSTIPMLRGLLSAKAGFGPTLTFLFVSPLLNPIIVGLIWATFGGQVTLLYASIATGVSILASMLLNTLGFERHIIPAQTAKSSPCAPTNTCCAPVVKSPVMTQRHQPNLNLQNTPAYRALTSSTNAISLQTDANCCVRNENKQPSTHNINFAQAGADAWQQFKAVLPYLLLGVLIGSFIYGFIPTAWIAEHASANNPLAIPFSALIGIPLYIRAEAVIPLASVLLAKGMGMGAVMALIIGSAGASLTEVVLLRSMFKTPMIVAFLTVILGMAVFMGYLTQMLF